MVPAREYKTLLTYAAVNQLPSLAHRRNLETRNFFDDPYQRAILPQLDLLYGNLVHTQNSDGLSAIWRLWSRAPKPNKEKKNGVYLWGSVGRGKTYLMDLLYESLPFESKKRVHFHRFMIGIHDQLKALGQKSNKIEGIALNIAQKYQILCLDELFVADIGDAIILERFISALTKHGTSLVITSNTAPDDLYHDGLQRQRFTPAITMIKKHMTVLELSGDHDYRLTTTDQADVYRVPHNLAAEKHIMGLFRDISGESGIFGTTVDINDRLVTVRGKGLGIVWFDFKVICAGYHSRVDFAVVSRIYHTVVLTDIPVLGKNDDDTRRFIDLIDELHDRGVNLIASAATEPERLYQGTKMRKEFRRTISRLNEFQSVAYISRPHIP